MGNRNIAPIIILIIALPVAIYLGVGAATEGIMTALKVIAVAGLFACAFLGRRIWLMMFFLSGLGLTLALPGTPTTALLGQGLFLGFGVLLLLMRRLPMQVKVNELHVWAALFLLCALQAYVRNPVGLSVFGTSSVGGRPYFIFAVAVAASLILSFMRVPPKELKWLVWLVIGAALISFGLSVVGVLVPALGAYYGAVSYDATDASDYTEIADPNAATRVQFLSPFATTLARAVTAFRSPIKACFTPWAAPIVLISFAAAAMSGYRSAIAMVGLTYLFGIFYRNGLKGVFLSAGALAMGLLLLAATNLVFPLPANVQRALSPLPGTWDERYVRDADYSTEWRTEMWQDALMTDRYIDNKWLGDGLGVSADKLRRAAALKDSGMSLPGWDASREAMMLTGNYHSGPVQTIRAVGYVGLVLLMLAKIRLAVYAHRLVRRAKGTEWFPVVLFFCIPMIWEPIFWFFVFGTFQNGAVSLFTGLALVTLMRNNLPLGVPTAPPSKEAYVPGKAHRLRPSSLGASPTRGT